MRRKPRHRVGFVLVLVAAAAAACGGQVTPSPSPSPSPSPTPTPDPHLTEPASLNAVFLKLGAAGLQIKANNADAGGPAGEPLKRINATYASWPLIMSEFSSSAALRKAGKFDPARPPQDGDPPYTFAGLNVLVEFGPRTPGGNRATPEPRFHAAALALILALDPLLGPLEQRSVDPLPLPEASASPASAGPSPSP